MSSIASIQKLGLPAHDLHDLPNSVNRFPDNAQFRIEIREIESPEQLKRVIQTSKDYGFTVHRASQDSGITLLTDRQIEEMAALDKSEGIEVSLFAGPCAGYDIESQVRVPSGGILGKRIRGMDQLLYAIEDVRRAAKLGYQSEEAGLKNLSRR